MLIGCSSDDSSTPAAPTNASIDSSNAEDLATAGTEAVKQAVNNDSVPTFGFARLGKVDPLKQLSAQVVTTPMATLIEGVCDSGTFDVTSSETSGSYTYDNCDIGGIIFDGSATYTSSTANNVTTFTISYSNFTITYGGEAESVDLTMTCTIDSNAGTVSCTYDSEALGIDGRTYTVTDIEVSGDDITGWTVSATVVDPDHGEVTITTSVAVNFGSCTNGQPESGSITVSDGTNEMSVTYNDCTSFTVDFDGSTTTYNW
jgi:hypothetical protein